MSHKSILWRLAETEAEKEQCFQLRYEQYCERLGWRPLNPSGLEIDRYDSHSLHIMAVRVNDDGTEDILGVVRLILPPLPAVRWYGIGRLRLPRGFLKTAVEVSRFAFAEDPDKGLAIRAIFLGMYEVCGACGINGLLITASQKTVEWLRMPFRKCGMRKWIMEEWCNPWYATVSDLLAYFCKNDPKLYTHLTREVGHE